MNDYLREGKSENYQDAEARGLLKAGEVAARLSKQLGMKVSAKELERFATEWHHAGVFKGNSGGALRGRKVYFFSEAAVQQITAEKILHNREKEQQKKTAGEKIVKGWYPQYFRMTDPVTRRVYSKPFVGIYTGPVGKAPKGFTVLDDEAFEKKKEQRGKPL